MLKLPATAGPNLNIVSALVHPVLLGVLGYSSGVKNYMEVIVGQLEADHGLMGFFYRMVGKYHNSFSDNITFILITLVAMNKSNLSVPHDDLFCISSHWQHQKLKVGCASFSCSFFSAS